MRKRAQNKSMLLYQVIDLSEQFRSLDIKLSSEFILRSKEVFLEDSFIHSCI